MLIIFGSSLGDYLKDPSSSANLAVALMLLLAIVILAKVLKLDVYGAIVKILDSIVYRIGLFISNKETKLKRELEIGKLNDKNKTVKLYRFMNDLIIDLGIKRLGVTPYSFTFLVLLGSLILSVVVCKAAFGNLTLSIIVYPIITVAVVCVLYTKANMAHDLRIEAVIEAENIIANSIKDGVVVSIRNSIDLIPEMVRAEFRDFLDNIEHKNYHIRTALLELNNNIGSIADDFIKKCIEFETQEEHGIVGMFRDVVELNNVKTELRTEMKRSFEKIFGDFVIGALMIFVFLGGTLVLFDNVANFYFNNIVGQIIIIIDVLIVIGEFVFITYLRAKEL